MRRFDPWRALLLVALFAAFLRWSDTLFYPVQLLVTILHEACHGLAAIATGGRIVRIEVFPGLGGRCLVQGGWPLVFIPAGYVGSTLAGAAILLASGRPGPCRSLAAVFGLGLLVMTALYVRTGVGIAGGVLYGCLLLAGAWKLPDWLSELAMSFLGIAVLFYAVVDLRMLLAHPEAAGHSDAALFSRLVPLPPAAWALLWTLVSLAVLVAVVRASISGPRRRCAPRGR